jgi:hypothetical protein
VANVLLVTPAFAQESVVGVWQRVLLDANRQVTPDPAPMLVVYTDVGVYVQVSFRLDRQDSRPLADLNADELRARFSGTSAQHGSFTVSGNRSRLSAGRATADRVTRRVPFGRVWR